MAYNVFLDTNVIVDFFLPERKGHNSAVTLIGLAEKKLLNICFSESVINTTAYLIRKSIYIDIFRTAMQELNTFIKVLPCTNIIIEDAYQNAKNDLEDAVLYQIALQGKMDYFITYNTKDFKKLERRALPIITTEEFIKII